MNGLDTPAVAGHALPERLQQLFRHTLREGLLNPLIHIAQTHRALQAEGLPGATDTSPDRSLK